MEENTLFLQDVSNYNPRTILDIMTTSFRAMLTNQSPRAEQPAAIRIPLKPHQLALIEGMRRKEQECLNGYSYKGTTTYSDYGVLGDDVGTGKSLVTLGYIATMKQQQQSVFQKQTLYRQSSPHIFTLQSVKRSVSSHSNLLVVPHTIYRQWEQYCQTQTDLKVFYAKSAKDLEFDNAGSAAANPEPVLADYTAMYDAKKAQREYKKAMKVYEKQKEESVNGKSRFRDADIVLCSNTLYRDVQAVAEQLGVRWVRMFLDEADSIHITNTSERPNAMFTWFITATWTNFVLNGMCVRPSTLSEYQANVDSYPGRWDPRVENWLQKELGIKTSSQASSAYSSGYGYNNYYGGKYVFYRIRSSAWLREFETEHILRGHMVLHCTPEFLQESEQMPPIHHQTILCEQPVSSRIVRGIVPADVQAMLDAGSVESALQHLGVSVASSATIVEAVTAERQKELKRLQKTLDFKKDFDYASPAAKEQALASLKAKIASVEQQLKTITERLTNTGADEECPVCYENTRENNGVLTPCCTRMFCGACILTSLTRTPTCPLCRASLTPSQLTHITEPVEEATNVLVKQTPESEEQKLRSKPRELLHFLKTHPEARVLIFSRYENPFVQLGHALEEENISYHMLKGNKDVIASQIRGFESGEKRVLFLPTEVAAAGMNLVSATHVVLLHAMTPDEEKQIIGRAYRLGRKLPLNVLHLLHEGEKIQ